MNAVGQLDEVEHRQHLVVRPLDRINRLERIELERAALVPQHRHQDVLIHGKLVEQRVDLIALAHAHLADACHAKTGDVLVAQVYAAMCGLNLTRQHAEKR